MSARYKIALVTTVLFLALVSFKENGLLTPYSFPKPVAFPDMPLKANGAVTVEGAQLGRYLFYDSMLSADYKLACAGCHRQEAAFSDGGQRFSKGHNGALQSRNTMPLFNLAWYPSLFWDGKAGSIEEQVFHPVRAHAEMNLQWPVAVQRINASRFYKAQFRAVYGNRKIDSSLVADAIGQFERTLISYRSRFDSVLAGKTILTKDEYDGFVIVNEMAEGDCLHCHTSDADALGTTLGYSNNGLDPIMDPQDYKDKGRGGITGDATDNGKFKIPSLRNLGFTAPYMHDGRFKTLEEVIDFYSEGVKPCANIDSKMGLAHQGGVRLTAEKKRKVIAFLNTLNDYALTTDPAFGDPFQKK